VKPCCDSTNAFNGSLNSLPSSCRRFTFIRYVSEMQGEAASVGVSRGWGLKKGTTAEAGKFRPGENTMYNYQPAGHGRLLTCPTVHGVLQTCCCRCGSGLHFSLYPNLNGDIGRSPNRAQPSEIRRSSHANGIVLALFCGER